ncbi:MAG: hypothetical protein SVU32_01105, partial [Candidatus Nanohaloarchaea archaeon]|nr:hypothetical protein [Candidatus Nanohaloarchaea archaeon]
TKQGKKHLWFTWGLISINTKQSIYRPNETAEIYMVVLDSEGQLVSGADVRLQITGPNGDVTRFSTANGTIEETAKSGVYRATFHGTDSIGTYRMQAQTLRGETRATIRSKFAVRDDYAFDIIRDFPHTMDPTKGPYTGRISTTSFTSAEQYTVREYIPANFTVIDAGGATVTRRGDTKILTWRNVTNGSTVSYRAEPPHVWPYLYRLGRAEITYQAGGKQQTFTEFRPWQLAVDPQSQFLSDDVSWSVVDTQGGQADAFNTGWIPNTNCTEAAGNEDISHCFISQINVTFYADTTSNSQERSYVEFGNNNSSAYRPADYDIPANSNLGPISSCGNVDDYATQPATCDLTRTDWFIPNTNFSVTVRSPKSGSASVSKVTYKWNWTREYPLLFDSNATAEEKVHTGGWGETWNFSTRVWDIQHDNVSVSAWITNTFSGETRKVFTTSIKGAGDTRGEANLTYFMYNGFGPNDAGTSWNVKFNATDYNGHEGNNSGPQINVEKDDVDIQLFNGNNSVV